MIDDPPDLAETLRSRLLIVLLTVALMVALRPHPVPDPLRRPLRSAAEHAHNGRAEAALVGLERALEFSPGLNPVRAYAAEGALESGHPERALEHLDRLPAQAIVPIDRICTETAARLQLADPLEAARLIEGAPLRCPFAPPILEELTTRALQAGEIESARTLVERWAQLQPESSDAALEFAIVSALESPLDVGAALERAIELDPGTRLPADLARAVEDGRSSGYAAYAHAQVGQALARAGRWSEARYALQRALELDPDYVEARAYYGLALDRSGGNGRAHLERAYTASDGAAIPASLLGLHWLEAGEPQRAIPYLEHAAALSPENPAYQAQLGAAHERKGDLQAARGYYERAAALDGPQFLMLAAQFSLRNEIALAELGIPAARRAYLLDSGPETADLLGYAHLLSGEFAVAERLLERAVAWAPSSPRAHYHLALLRLERGQTGPAVALLERTVELDPDGRYGEFAQRALERLGG